MAPKKPQVVKVFKEIELLGEEIQLKLSKKTAENIVYTNGGYARDGIVCSPATCQSCSRGDELKEIDVRTVLQDNVTVADEVVIKIRRSS